MENREFEILYLKYVNEVFKFLYRLSGNYHIAEELTQETFVRAYKSLDDFRGECQLKVWLCQIAKNLYFDDLKKCKNNISLDVEENSLFINQVDFIDNIIKKDTLISLGKLIRKLKEPYQEILIQHLLLELSYGEISMNFGKSETWVRVNFYRAKQKLQTLYQEMEVDDGEM
jgi:RNA polymerase sigma-70 factor (ECF subfamily)